MEMKLFFKHPGVFQQTLIKKHRRKFLIVLFKGQDSGIKTHTFASQLK